MGGAGLLFVAGLLAYIVFVYLQGKAVPNEAAVVAEHRAEDAKRPATMALSVAMAVAGITITILAHVFWWMARLLWPKGWGVGHDHRPDDRGGGHVHARLVTSVMAAIRKHADMYPT